MECGRGGVFEYVRVIKVIRNCIREEGQPRAKKKKKESYKKAHLSAGSPKTSKSAKTVSQN
ncbi:hypothetical protein E2C01_081569 [Portunus trituberculatus]|uniref:Uncharacterized protein n=1 Tax=Portunus trituberculatus TaxID=210409 RepID=A0A5B7IWP5_PORTR|nr:hypothetical protein [Portunus trituberculatus]